MSCAVALCCNKKSRRIKNKRYGFVLHRFPTKNKKMCKIWVKRCMRADKINITSATICSDHFADNDYKVDLMHRLIGLPERRRLKEDAVPSLKLPGKKEKAEEEKMRARRREERLRSRNIRRDALRRIRELTSSDDSDVFSEAQELSLTEYLVHCSNMCYGTSTKDFQELAYEMAKIYHKKIPESWEKNQKAEIGWMEGFFKRHPRLCVRQPEGCSLSRSTCFNKHNVGMFYKKLKCALDRSEKFADGTRIYNIAEIATATVELPKPVTVEEGSRSAVVTSCCIISASGCSLPPAVVFPRYAFEEHMIDGAPPGTLVLATSSGWVTGEVFVSVMKHFIKHSGSSIDDLTILIMDTHDSHLTIQTLKLAEENGVIIVTLPPYSSSKLQPLDVSVAAPFKAHYNSAANAWSLDHPATPMTVDQVAQCVVVALKQVLKPLNIKEGFRATGIFPFNNDIFRDRDFLQDFKSTKSAESKKTKKGHISCISTDTREKNKMELDLNKRVLRKRKTVTKALGEKVFTLDKVLKFYKKVQGFVSSSSEDESDENELVPQVDPKCVRELDREPVEKGFVLVEFKEGISHFQVEFKPEMWEDDSSKEPDAKKTKNSQEKVLSDNSETSKEDVSSSGTLACCALACPNTHETHSMVRLPQDKELRSQWVGQIGRSLMDWTPDKHSALCEVHFDGAQWDRNEEGARVLRPDAVPSLALRGEAVRSWVTLDAGVLKPEKSNGIAEGRESDAEEESDIFIKREALEPEIDMVEGSEAVLSQDDCPRDPFETIYCDSTFREDEDNLNGGPHNMQIKFEQEDESFEDYNDESLNPLGDSEVESSTADGPRPTALLIKAQLLRKKVRRRSAQLTDDFQCPICERKLSRRKNLEIHIKKLHPNGEMSETQKRQKAEEDALKPKPKKSLKSPPPLAPLHINMGSVPYPIINGIFSTAVPSSNLVAAPSSVAIPGLVTTSKPSLNAPLKAVNSAEKSISPPKLLASPTIIVQSPKDTSPSPGSAKTPALSAGVTSPSPMVSTSVVSMPRPNDPSPAGGEIHKQFVLLLPKALGNQPPPPANKEDIFSMNLINVPLDKRLALMEKLKELVDAVVSKKLDPEKIIIAYDRTLDC